MIEECRKQGIPEPEFKEYSGGLVVIFRFAEPIGIALSNAFILSLLPSLRVLLLNNPSSFARYIRLVSVAYLRRFSPPTFHINKHRLFHNLDKPVMKVNTEKS